MLDKAVSRWRKQDPKVIEEYGLKSVMPHEIEEDVNTDLCPVSKNVSPTAAKKVRSKNV